MPNKVSTTITPRVNELNAKFHQKLLSGVEAPAYICDLDGYVQLYNKAASLIWGIEPKIGKTKWCGSWKIYNTDGSQMPFEECPMAITLKGGSNINGEEIIVERPDGTRLHVLPHPKLIKDSESKIIGAITILQDTTILNDSEQKLREVQFEEKKRYTIDFSESKLNEQQLEKAIEARAKELEKANKDLTFQYSEKAKRAAELVIANTELAFQNGEKVKRAAELVIANGELVFQNEEKEKRAAELIVANDELVYQNEEKGKRAAELILANADLTFQNTEKGKRAAELILANEEMVFQNEEKGKRAAELAIAVGELAFQNEEKEKRAAELIIANRELAFQIKRAAELIIANGELSFQNREKEKRASELIIANGELAYQNGEKGKRAAELIIANGELAYQNDEKGKRAAELVIANGELAFQNGEKEKRASELIIANGELAFQNGEKGKRASELLIANRELVFQNEEKGKRAAELSIANEELIFQNSEKEKRAAELVIANRELVFQNNEKVKRAAELIVANGELEFQNTEKGKRAAELIIANGELAFQIGEKEKRAAELVIANKELNLSGELLRNSLKKISDYKYALDESTIVAITNQKGVIKKVNSNFCKISKYTEAELIGQDHSIVTSGYHSKEFIRDLWITIANGKIWKGEFKNKAKDGTFYWVDTTIVPFLDEHNKPYQYLAIRFDITNRKEADEDLIQRTLQLKTVNKELAFQNKEKEKHAAELILVNEELGAFSYVSSHDLQEPLRKIQTLSDRILKIENDNLSEIGKDYLNRVQLAAARMRLLINDLLSFSQLSMTERKFEIINLNTIIEEVKNELKEVMEEKHVTIEAAALCEVRIIPFQFRQIMYNLISNALKFSKPDRAPHIIIKSTTGKGSIFNEEKLLPEIKYCHISISDNGIGFEQQDSNVIFGVFQRLHNRDKYAGSGIGLAIVKKVVDNHNGMINATGKLNEGAIFNIYIPVSPE